MKQFRNENNEMSLSTWYDDYLMLYVQIFNKPKYTEKQTAAYNDLLLQWYANWNGKAVEVTKD